MRRQASMSSAATRRPPRIRASSIASGGRAATRSKARSMRSSAAKRFTAVGRVEASSRRAVANRSAGGVEAPLRIENAAP